MDIMKIRRKELDAILALKRALDIASNSRDTLHLIDITNRDLEKLGSALHVDMNVMTQACSAICKHTYTSYASLDALIASLRANTFYSVKRSSTRTDLPDNAELLRPLEEIGITEIKFVQHALPPEHVYLAFTALHSNNTSIWSLLCAAFVSNIPAVPVRLSLPMRVKDNLTCLSLTQHDNAIDNTLRSDLQGSGLVWFAWRPTHEVDDGSDAS